MENSHQGPGLSSTYGKIQITGVIESLLYLRCTVCIAGTSEKDAQTQAEKHQSQTIVHNYYGVAFGNNLSQEGGQNYSNANAWSVQCTIQ